MSVISIGQKNRKTEVEVHHLFNGRWSPRSMTGEEMTREELLPLFEAAKWAPSSYNSQPWRFIIAHSKFDRDKFLEFMVDFNKQWAGKAAALILVVSLKNFEHNGAFSSTHSFDTGAAWMSLALEGARRGYVVHGMVGFDFEKARLELKIPEEYHIEAMVAIGKLAKAKDLPKELVEMEKPSLRKPVSEIISWGEFKWK